MGTDDLAHRRRQMGEALAGWAAVPGAEHAVSDVSWTYLSNLPSADVNMALVHGGDPDDLQAVVDRIDEAAVPAMVFFSGDGLARAQDLDAGWSHAGSMPFMICEVAGTPQKPDPRVRRGTAEDMAAVVGLMADAFGLSPEVIGPIVEVSLAGQDGAMAAWLLEDEGQAVSTVVSGRVGDAITLWCMATPERFARRGYARALLASTMARAASEGVRVGLLGATPAGKPLYDATGWSTLEDWEIFMNGDSAQFH
jgi:GNAT superfamily N-acetyltransferase